MANLSLIITVPDTVGTVGVQGFLAQGGGYVPPKNPDGTFVGNDTLGCDSLGVPTAAGKAAYVAKVIKYITVETLAGINQAVDAEAKAAKDANAATLAAVPITGEIVTE